MPSKLDQLKNAAKVFHRSSTRISKAPATIFLDEKCVEIMIKFDGGSDQHKILIMDIDSLKNKDFNDSATKAPLYILSVNLKDGTHNSFQFETRHIRDEWDHGLRSLHSGAAQQAQGEVKVPQSQFLPIKSITLQKPSAGQLVSIKLQLGKEGEDVKRECDLVVLEGKTSSDDCKELAVQFVEDNSILPTEQKSLYRYIRSVVQRAQMEKEVVAIVEEVNSQSFERLAAEQGGSVDPQQIAVLAKARLTTIYNQIPLRIGQHGSGASIATQVLKRNVKKMEIINDLAAQLAAASR